MEYINGNRKHPIWGFGGNDFLCEDQNGDRLGSSRTIFLVREKNNETVLDAMKNGRMYAVRQVDANRLSLDEFVVEDQKSGNQITMGQEMVATDFPAIKMKLRSIQGGNKTVQIQIIRNGTLVKEETVSLPYELIWRDVGVKKQGTVYYRIKAIVSPENHLVSNPIFVKFADNTGLDIASAAPSPAPTAPQIKKLAVPKTQPMPQPKAPEVTSISEAPVPPVSSVPAPSQPREIRSPVPALQPSITKPVNVEKEANEPTPQKLPMEELPPGRRLTIMTDGVPLKKGPGTIFPNIAKLPRGEQVHFVRRTNIEFNSMNWLVVKHKNRSGYIWEGVVKWAEDKRDPGLH